MVVMMAVVWMVSGHMGMKGQDMLRNPVKPRNRTRPNHPSRLRLKSRPNLNTKQ